MGEGSEGIAASSGGSENNGLGSCEAHHVGISPQEDRGGSKSEMGEVEGRAEEGGLDPGLGEENDSSHLQTEEKIYAACNRGGKTRP
jgi:hypothetical protein